MQVLRELTKKVVDTVSGVVVQTSTGKERADKRFNDKLGANAKTPNVSVMTRQQRRRINLLNLKKEKQNSAAQVLSQRMSKRDESKEEVA